MRFGSLRQRAHSRLMLTRMTDVERNRVYALAEDDELRPTDYIFGRVGGSLYADNGMSLIYNVTLERNIDADSFEEAAKTGPHPNLP